METTTHQTNESKENSQFPDIELQTLTPTIFVKDIQQTIAFYRFLGFVIVTTVPDDHQPVFAWMRSGKVSIMFQTFESIGNTLPAVSRKDGGSLLLYINMKGVRNYYGQIKDSVTVLQQPAKTFYGATEFSILDNNHYVLTFAEDE